MQEAYETHFNYAELFKIQRNIINKPNPDKQKHSALCNYKKKSCILKV